MTPESPTDEQVQAALAYAQLQGGEPNQRQIVDKMWDLAEVTRDQHDAQEKVHDLCERILAAALTAERAKREALQAWKDSMLEVDSSWKPQEVAKALGIPLGADIRKNILPKIRELIAKREEAEKRALSAEFWRTHAEQTNTDFEADYLAIWKMVKQPNMTVRESVAALKAAKEELEKELSRRWDKATQEHYEKLEAELGRMRVQFDNLKAAKEEAEAVAGQRYHYALNEPILKARIEELSQDRDVCLVRAEKAEAEVARLKAAVQYPQLTAGTADSLAYELEQHDGFVKVTPTVVALWLRALAKMLRALANREAAQQTREEAKEGSCVHCGKPWYVNMPQCVFHPDTPQQAAQPSATQREQCYCSNGIIRSLGRDNDEGIQDCPRCEAAQPSDKLRATQGEQV